MWGRLVGLFAGVSLILGVTPAQAATQNEFITTWDTQKIGSSNSQTIVLPLTADGSYDFYADWGDGTVPTRITTSSASHQYAVPGQYTVKITGQIQGWRFNSGGDAAKLLNVSHWGPLALGDGGHYFDSATALTITATDAPDLSGVTSMAGAFRDCRVLTGGLSHWSMSGVTDMSSMFERAYLYDEDLSGWNTANVTTMRDMFYDARVFNGDVSAWNTGSVTNMAGMFDTAPLFSQPIGAWNTANVTDMNGMFAGASHFDQPIGDWNTSKVTDIRWMFAGAVWFRQDISKWDVSHVTSLYQTFTDARSFNTNISAWDVSNVTDLRYTFAHATGFNQSLAGWDTSNVTSMEYTFADASHFNQSLGTWNIGKVTSFGSMLKGTSFRPPAYDATLVGWAGQPGAPSGRALWIPTSHYASDAATSARAHLVDDLHWTITDLGRAALPEAPTGVAASGSDASIAVTWIDSPTPQSVPNDFFTATATPGGASCQASSTTCTITGLTNGVEYTVSVTATTAVGTSPAAATTGPIVPLGRATSPQDLVVTGSHRRVEAHWRAPADTGGSAVSGYTATLSPGGATCSTIGTDCAFTGLQNRTSYRVTVVAITALGAGREAQGSATTEAAWPQTARPLVAKSVNARRTVLLRTGVTTNAGQRARATVRVQRKAASVRITKTGKIVLRRKTDRPFSVTLRLSAPATDDHGSYSYTRRWRAHKV